MVLTYLQAVERGDTDCPICLTELHLSSGQMKSSHRHDVQSATVKTINQKSNKPLSNDNASFNPKLSRKQQDRQLLEKLSSSLRSSPSAEKEMSDPGHDSLNANDVNVLCSEAKRNTSIATSDSLEKLPNVRKPRSSASSMFVTQSKQELDAPTATGQNRIRATVLLSCTHVFHSTCLRTLEEMAMVDMRNTCPVCRAHYQKKVITFWAVLNIFQENIHNLVHKINKLL